MVVNFFVIAGMLFALAHLFPRDFELKKEGWIIATVALTLTQWLMGYLLGIPKFIMNVITLGLLTIVINWLANSFIFWVADKFSDNITAKSTKMIFIGGAALSFANWLATYIVAKIV